MIKVYPHNSLGDLLLNHNNNYGPELLNKKKIDFPLPNLTVAIPYFEAKNTINLSLRHLFISIEKIKKNNPEWNCEILVIDDGSINYPAQKNIEGNFLKKIELLVHKINLGRYAARNTAIRNAKYEFILFSDADVLMNYTILREHLEIKSKSKKNNKNVVTTSIFNFVDIKQIDTDTSRLFFKTNDFRVSCRYQDTWIGSEYDKQYIGQDFKILKQTNNLRNWPKTGFLGPWVLSNMVLGGLFGISTNHARKVGGCDSIFSNYGFEETSLVTKLIAIKNTFVVPVKQNYAIHMLDSESMLTRKKKDYFFQKSHKLNFKKYLYYDKNQAIKEKI